MDRKITPTVEQLVGTAVIFSIVVGFIALLAALAAFLNSDYSAVGLSLIAAALGFGLLSVAIMKR